MKPKNPVLKNALIRKRRIKTPINKIYDFSIYNNNNNNKKPKRLELILTLTSEN